MYEETILKLDEPTPHQKEKLKLVSQDKDFHIRAAAGAGKTFVALNHLIKTLKAKKRCLYVARNPALCLSVVKWVEMRLRPARLLSHLMLLHEPLEQPRTIKITAAEPSRYVEALLGRNS